MKVTLNLIALCFSISFVFVSCKKENSFSYTNTETIPESYKKNVDTYLKATLIDADYNRIDLNQAKILIFNDGKSYFLRIPFLGKLIEKDFIAIRTDTVGKCFEGNFVNYDKFNKSNNLPSTINITNLARNKSWEFDFDNIPTNFPVPSLADANSVNVARIRAYQNTSTNIIDWMNIAFLLYPSSASVIYGGNGGGNGYGVPTAGVTSGSFGTYGYYFNNAAGGSGSPSIQNSDKVEFEDNGTDPAIDINKIFNCFNAIPDAGASYVISLNSDIPVNSSPNRAASFPNGSPGHTFITITKVNGTATVTKSFGFYPTGGYKTILDPYGYFPSKIVNNSNHEINSSLARFVNQAQFNLIKNEAIVYSSRLYSIATSNCTDYALTVFNSAFPIADKITLSPFVVYTPTNPPVPIVINNSPQMLFGYTRNLGFPEDGSTPPPGISINTNGTLKAALSPGECN
jgi:hypothetical protein